MIDDGTRVGGVIVRTTDGGSGHAGLFIMWEENWEPLDRSRAESFCPGSTRPMMRSSSPRTRLRPSRDALVAAMAVVCCAVSFGATPARVLRDDGALLQGRWLVADARVRTGDDPATPLDGPAGHATLVIATDKVTMTGLSAGGDAARTFTFSLDTAASPRRITLVAPSDGGKWVGIYRLVADTLSLALPVEHWADRPVPPASFEAPNTLSLTLKRQAR